MQVGSVVKLKIEILGNPVGTIGFVYETYDIGDGPGVSVIFPNGNYDGFSPDDQKLMLKEVGIAPEELTEYQFINVYRLSMDFDSGLFDCVLGGDAWKRI
jgi:hypothetical protein